MPKEKTFAMALLLAGLFLLIIPLFFYEYFPSALLIARWQLCVTGEGCERISIFWTDFVIVGFLMIGGSMWLRRRLKKRR
ncbi:MAG: hypothetical protein JRD69_01495 [Deltaproteobacteria bacterium]|nr:hypothetical protein [Deltaproteobacteria bacterium]